MVGNSFVIISVGAHVARKVVRMPLIVNIHVVINIPLEITIALTITASISAFIASQSKKCTKDKPKKGMKNTKDKK